MEIAGDFALVDTRNAGPDEEESGRAAPPLKELVRAALAQCQQRRHILPELMLEDPRWLMALDLLLGVAEQRAVTVTNLAIAAGVPFTTALRHINAMVNEGLVHRVDHPTDRRVVFVELSPELHEQIVAYLRIIYGLTERLRTAEAAPHPRLELPAADNDENRGTGRANGSGADHGMAVSPPPASLRLSGWNCVERTNGRYVSTILTRNDVSIALVLRDSESQPPEVHVIRRVEELFPEIAPD